MKSKIHEYENKYVAMSKNTIALLIALFISISSFAQQGINYDLGNVLASNNI